VSTVNLLALCTGNLLQEFRNRKRKFPANILKKAKVPSKSTFFDKKASTLGLKNECPYTEEG
jgi:hypothetical protein